MRNTCLVLLLGIMLCFAGCTFQDKSLEQATPPKLVVFISIDQWHQDLLERYKDHYTGGFKAIWQQSRFYRNAFHDHAATLTGPGHSVLLTGAFPNKTGITGNYFYDHESQQVTYCVADPEQHVIGVDGVLEGRSGVSPVNLLTPTVGDLLKARYPQSKVYSVSGKDRSGILMAGRKADGVFWYDKSIGQLVTSSFYAQKLPGFIQNFNQQHPIQQYAPDTWRRLKPASFYDRLARKDLFDGERLIDNKNFPYRLKSGADTRSFHSMVSRTPFADRYILEASQYIINSQQLGQDETPDLISIGLSATDYIGHTWGPYSQEALDHMLRLDRYLGDFFDSIKQQFGDDVVIALSADHGVQPLPEYLVQQGRDSKRIPKQRVIDDVMAIADKLQQEFGHDKPLIELKAGHYFLFNDGVSMKQRRRLAKEIEQLDYIQQVVLADALSQSEDNNSRYVQRVFYKPRAQDMYLLFKPYYLVNRSLGTTHGSVHQYDQQVPIAFIGKSFQPTLVEDKVSTTDIAPTLAKALQLNYQGFDGKALP